MTESESVALPLGDTPSSVSLFMGWVVGFEPTYTGATTLGLNHLTIPTILVNFVHCHVAVSFILGYVHWYVPFGTHSTRLALRKISCAYLIFLISCIATLLSRSSSVAYTGTCPSVLAQRALHCAKFPAHTISAVKKNWRPGTGSNRRPPA